MSIPVKVGNQEILVFDITTDDIRISNLGNISSDIPAQTVASLCTTGQCYQCGTQQCNQVKCSNTQCNQVKCNQIKCNTTRCGYTRDSNCSYCGNDM